MRIELAFGHLTQDPNDNGRRVWTILCLRAYVAKPHGSPGFFVNFDSSHSPRGAMPTATKACSLAACSRSPPPAETPLF